MQKFLSLLVLLLTACAPAGPVPAVTLTATSFPEGVTQRPGTSEIFDSKGVRMVLVPEGEFSMGSDYEYDGAKPVHIVYLDAFYIDKYEVTNALYAACVSAGTCQPPYATSSFAGVPYYGNPEFDNHPVSFVNWEQAKTYCEWRGARLPTEAEWEKAARGTDERVYPWGNDFDGTFVNFCDKNCSFPAAHQDYDDGYAETAPVDSYPDGQSPYGVYNMAGNVWEWVADQYSETYYRDSPARNPPGPDSGEGRILRGGSWINGLDSAGFRSASRGWNNPVEIVDPVGIRCVRGASP